MTGNNIFDNNDNDNKYDDHMHVKKRFSSKLCWNCGVLLYPTQIEGNSGALNIPHPGHTSTL